MANEFKIKNGLVVSGSADVEQNLTVNGILTAKQYNVSLISSSILFESGSTQLGNSLDDTHLFTGSIKVTGSITLNGQPIGTGKLDETTFENYTSSTDSRLGLLENSTGSIRNDFNSFTSSYTNVSGSLDSRLDTLETLSGSFTGSFSGSFVGDGTNLFNIPASGVTGLNLTQIADGSVTASVSNTNGLRVNSKSEITGSLIVTNGITGSIDYSNITNKPTLVSGSSQIEITGTTGYSTFSSSVSTSIGGLSSSLDLLSSSVATTDSNQNTRLGLIETSTGSLNTFTSSALTRFGTIETSTGSLNTFTSSALTRFGTIETSTGSLNSFTSSALTRVSAIEISTGSLNSFTSSIDTTIKTKLNSDNVISGSIQVNITGTTGYSTFSSSISSSIGDLSSSLTTTTNNLSSSIATTDLNQSNKIGNLEVSSGSLNSFTSSIDTTIKNKLNGDNVISGSSQVTLSATTGYSTFSSSIATTDLNQTNKLNSIETSTGSLNSFTSSIDTTIKTKLNTENVVSGSSQVLNGSGVWSGSAQLPSGIVSGSSQLPSGLVSGSSQILNGTTIHSGSFFNDITVVSGSGQISYMGITNIPSGLVSGSSQVLSGTGIWSGSAQLPNGVVSGSSQVDITSTTNYTSFSSSIATTDLNQNNRLDSIETKTGSYATTGSNVFKSNQTISGSVIITENLTVFGSSSITYVTSSQLRVDDNIITVNTASPGSRFGGLEVHDSGSVGIATGSILWDSVNNRWIYQQSSEATYGGGMFLSGPRSSGSLGSELSLTSGKIARSAGGDHLNDSIITEYGGTTIGISGNLEISGSLVIPSIPLVSGSGQISFNGITDKPTLVSGSSQVLNGSGVWSGSSQLPSGVVSGSSQVLSGTGIWSGSAQLPSGVVSSSLQTIANLPVGTVSGSSQITFGSISGIPSGLVSGSSQVLAGTTIHSGSFFNGITVVSGSGQISFGGITGVPGGLVSGSSQVLSGTGIWSGSAQLPSGVVSGSSQVLSGTGIWSGSAQLPSGVVSGSAQTIANLPSGTVSGSSQVLLSSGVVSGSYVSSITGTANQVIASTSTGAVTLSLPQSISTTSTPTFGGGTFNGAVGVSATGVLSYGLNITGVAGGARDILLAGLSGFSNGFTVQYNGTSMVYEMRNGNLNIGGTVTATNFSGTHSGTSSGTNTGDQTLSSLGGQPQLNGTGFVKVVGTTVSYDNSTYLTSITSGNVTTALGYTPYNSTNPSGYISSITSGNVTTALGYTPYNATNPNGYITGISFANVSSKPTTLSGYGITDGVKTNGTLTGNIDSDWGESFTTFDPVPTGTPPLSSPNIRTVNIGNNFARRTQLAFDYASDVAYFRRRNDSGWQTWREFIHSGNIGSQTVATAGALSSMNISQFTNNSNYLTSISSGNVTTALGYTPYNATNPNGYITGISFANVSSKPTTISGYGITDAITTGNIGSQSVSYASSAGSAPNASNQNSAYLVTPGEGNGLKFWADDNYKISMGASSVYQYGTVTDYSIKTQMNSGDAGRGFTWGRIGIVPIASLNATSGNMQLAGSLTTGGSILPLSNNSVNLGSVSLGWANVYTNDLHLSNMNKPEGNDVDGTKGTWTIQEGAENLYIINNNNGKKFKINLEEII